MKIKTLVEFSGVPKDSTGECVEDLNANWSNKKVWKVTWNLPDYNGRGRHRSKPLIDWFDEFEFKKYLVILK